MRNAEQRLAAEAGDDRSLDFLIGFEVDGRCGLVADDDLRVADECSRQGEELALAEREVEAFVFDGRVEVDAAGLVGDVLLVADKIGLAQSVPQGEILMLVEGIQVAADGAAEESGVLRDDGEAGAQVVQADGGSTLR